MAWVTAVIGSPPGVGRRRGEGDERVLEVGAGDLEVVDRQVRPGTARGRCDPRRRDAAGRHSPRTSTSVTPGRRRPARSASAPARSNRIVRAPIRRTDRTTRAVGHDPAVVEDDDAVGDLVGLLEVVGGEQDRPTVGRRAGACPPRTPAGSRRPWPRSARRGRRGRGRRRSPMREPQALALAAGQPVDRAIGRGRSSPARSRTAACDSGCG